MLKRLFALVRKEFIQIGRDRRTLAMMIFIPFVWLSVFGYAANFEVKEIPLALINESSSPLAAELVKSVKGDTTFHVMEDVARSRTDLVAAMDKGTVKIGLIIPGGFGEPPANGQNPTPMTILVDGSDFFAAQTATARLSVPLQRLAGDLQARLTAPKGSTVPAMKSVELVQREVLYNPDLRSANVMIPGLTGMVILFITTLMTALGIVREKEQGTLEQIVVSPITPFELILGKLIPYTLIGLLDFAIVVGAGIFLFQIPFAGSLLAFSGMAVLFLMSTLGLGLLVSTVAQNQQQAMQMAMFTLFPQILLSGFIFPLGAMPRAIQYISYLFPLTYFMPIARGMFLKGVSIGMLANQALLLGLYGVAMITFASFRFRKRLG